MVGKPVQPKGRATYVISAACCALALSSACAPPPASYATEAPDAGEADVPTVQPEASDSGQRDNGGLTNSPEHRDGGESGGSSDGGTGDCKSDRVSPPQGTGCTCHWVDCEASRLACVCGLECYQDDSDCLISTDPDGHGSSDDPTLGECGAIECVPEDDLSEEMRCDATDCHPTPNTTSIEPVSDPPVLTPSIFDGDRTPVDVRVLFVVDNSRSMADDQAAAACAMSSFFDAASAKGASYQTGVITTDIWGDGTGSACTVPNKTYAHGTFVGAPKLIGLSGDCTNPLSCTCPDESYAYDVCRFNQEGQWLSSSDPESQDKLRKLIVQGQACSNYEAGLENAFQFFADMERNGTFDPDIPSQVIFISDEDPFAEDTVCSGFDRQTGTIPNFNPPAPTPGDCHKSLIDFYSYYFTSRNLIAHGLHSIDRCSEHSKDPVGYREVIEATGGELASICECGGFPEFFAKIGEKTADLSTALCFPDGVDPDPATIVVTYTEGNASEPVPESAVDGWTLDTSRSCLNFSGSWGGRHGSYRLEYIDRNIPPEPVDPVACLDQSLDILEDTLSVKCGAETVPSSATNGWTFDPATYCLTFHGDWVDATCAFTVEYF